MKKYFNPVLIVVSIAMLILSCKEDEKVDPLVGTWKLYSEASINCDDPNDDYTDIYSCTDTSCLKITFKSDGKILFEEKDGGITVTIEGTWQKSGTQLILCIDSSCNDPADYTISNGTLTITSSGDFGCTSTIVLKK